LLLTEQWSSTPFPGLLRAGVARKYRAMSLTTQAHLLLAFFVVMDTTNHRSAYWQPDRHARATQIIQTRRLFAGPLGQLHSSRELHSPLLRRALVLGYRSIIECYSIFNRRASADNYN
jgi:hypothetical protein